MCLPQYMYFRTVSLFVNLLSCFYLLFCLFLNFLRVQPHPMYKNYLNPLIQQVSKAVYISVSKFGTYVG